jgi:hypothetical protein
MGREIKKSPALICLLLAAGTLAVYWPVTGFGFISGDDTYMVPNNPFVRAGLTPRGFAWALTSFYYEYWHPVTWLSHMLDCTLFGLRPGWHHFVNAGIHAANAVLLFVVLRRMTGAQWRSAIVAALLALHPLHVESVAWIAERKDVLSGFFFMLTLWAYVRYAEGQRPPSAGGSPKAAGSSQYPASGLQPPTSSLRPRAIGWYLLTLGLFALGLMCKPMLMTAPFVLLLLDYWPLGRIGGAECGARSGGQQSGQPLAASLWSLFLEKLPFFALSASSAAITYAWAHNSGNLIAEKAESWSFRLANVPVSYARYLGKMLWPVNLAFPYPTPSHWAWWQTGGAVVIVLAITFRAARRARSAPYLIVGWLLFLGMLVPTIRLMHHGYQSIADRYTYLPSIGISIAVVWAAVEWGGRGRRAAWLAATAGLAILGCAGLTRHQLQYWRSTLSLVQRAVAVTKDNYLAEEDLGVVLAKQGQMEAGRAHIEESLRIKPDHPNGHFNLGFWFMQNGQPAEAIREYREALRLHSDYSKAMNNLAWMLATQPDPRLRNGEEAARLARRAADLNGGNDPESLDTLAAAYAETHQFAEAIKVAERAAELAQSAGQTEMARQIQARLKGYRSEQPYHEP